MQATCDRLGHVCAAEPQSRRRPGLLIAARRNLCFRSVFSSPPDPDCTACRCQAEFYEHALNQTHPCGGGWPRPPGSSRGRPAVVPLFPWRWRRGATARPGEGMMYRGPGGGGAGIGRGGKERGRDGASEGGGREQVAAGERRYQEEGSLRQQSEAKKIIEKYIHLFAFCLRVWRGNTHLRISAASPSAATHNTQQQRRYRGHQRYLKVK